jgi:LacI family transcriptional regulator
MARNESARPTIRDIAALAGVTAGTVSRVVNGRPGVGPEMRARIEQLVMENGYRINSSARQLSTGRSQTIAVVFPLHASEVVMHPVYPELLGALGDAAEQADYDLLLLTVTSPAKRHRLLDTVARRRIDGVILPAAGPRDRTLRELSTAGIPIVTIGHRTTSAGSAWVDCTHDAAAEELTTRLIRSGRRDVFLLNGPEHVSACRLRARGFRHALGKAPEGVRGREGTVPFSTEQAQQAAHMLLAAADRPTAVVAGSDLIASATLDAARQVGLRVPEDLAVTGFDDQSLAVHTNPNLTTVRMPLHEIGNTAANMLFAQLSGGQAARRHTLLATEIVVRESTPPGF